MAKYANLSADEIRGHRMLVFRRTVAYIVLILVCIICIFPFVMLLVNTTKDTSTLKTNLACFRAVILSETLRMQLTRQK